MKKMVHTFHAILLKQRNSRVMPSKPMKSRAIPEDKSIESQSQFDTKPNRKRRHTFRINCQRTRIDIGFIGHRYHDCVMESRWNCWGVTPRELYILISNPERDCENSNPERDHVEKLQ
jgi:hypothetical protein